HAVRAADDIDTRQSPAFHQVVIAIGGWCHAIHDAHILLETARNAQLVVIEVVEETHDAARQRRRHTGTATTDTADILHRALTDPVARAIVSRRVETRIERDRSPVEQFQSIDSARQSTGDASEGERTGHGFEIQIVERDVGIETRPLPERLFESQIADGDLAI